MKPGINMQQNVGPEEEQGRKENPVLKYVGDTKPEHNACVLKCDRNDNMGRVRKAVSIQLATSTPYLDEITLKEKQNLYLKGHQNKKLLPEPTSTVCLLINITFSL